MPAIVIPAPISSNHAAPVTAGGTGATTAAAARANLDVYSKAEVNSAISQSTAAANLVVREYNHQYSIPALANVFWNPSSDSIALSGYSILGVVGFATNAESVLPINVILSGGNYGIGLHNRASATATGTFSYRILYVKNA